MIVYYKLANILKERNMNWKDLCKCGVSVNIPTKFSQNKPVNTETIDKICEFLKVQPGDIMEWVEKVEDLRERELLSQIEALQKQLEELKKQ